MTAPWDNRSTSFGRLARFGQHLGTGPAASVEASLNSRMTARFSGPQDPLGIPDQAGRKERRDDILVLAAIATMGLAAGNSCLAQVSAHRFDRLAIQEAETVNAVARRTGQSTEELAELIEALEGHGDLRMYRALPLPISTLEAQYCPNDDDCDTIEASGGIKRPSRDVPQENHLAASGRHPRSESSPHGTARIRHVRGFVDVVTQPASLPIQKVSGIGRIAPGSGPLIGPDAR